MQLTFNTDTQPPAVVLTTDPPLLWPPNHEVVPVRVTWQIQDLCDPAPGIALQSVTSSEPDDAPGLSDGDTLHDVSGAVQGTADDVVGLRAERLGAGPGRTYELTYRAFDASGNASPALATVTVPHDQGSSPEPLLLKLEPSGPSGSLRIYWSAVPGALAYDVITGDLRAARVQGGAGDPPLLAGEAAFYLIQARTDRGGTGYGIESAPWPRVPDSCAGGCP